MNAIILLSVSVFLSREFRCMARYINELQLLVLHHESITFAHILHFICSCYSPRLIFSAIKLLKLCGKMWQRIITLRVSAIFGELWSYFCDFSSSKSWILRALFSQDYNLKSDKISSAPLYSSCSSSHTSLYYYQDSKIVLFIADIILSFFQSCFKSSRLKPRAALAFHLYSEIKTRSKYRNLPGTMYRRHAKAQKRYSVLLHINILTECRTFDISWLTSIIGNI